MAVFLLIPFAMQIAVEVVLMIEVTPEMWQQKARMARGEIPFVEDKLCDELLALSLPDFRKHTPRWQNYAGMHGEAKRKFESLKEVA